jgi:hypothetical protein
MGIPDPHLETLVAQSLEDRAAWCSDRKQHAKQALLQRAALIKRDPPPDEGTGPPLAWHSRLKGACCAWLGRLFCGIALGGLLDAVFSDLPRYVYQHDF